MDYIYIENENKEIISYEAVTIFNIEDSDYNYIVYRSLDKHDYYIAKYFGDNIVDLNTDLTEKELEVGKSVLEGVSK